jgi:two-component system response regulator
VIDYLFRTGVYAGREPDESADLLLLDLKMPKMDGLQVLQVLRRVRSLDRSKLPPVVILTSSRQDKDIVRAYRLGAHSYIQKPTSFVELVEAVRRIVEYWLGLNKSAPARWRDARELGARRPPASFLDQEYLADANDSPRPRVAQ